MIRLLHPGDEALLETFLQKHATSSMFLRSNVRNVGLVDRGERYHGTYAACFAEQEIVSVAAHAWNGMLLLQAPRDLPEVVRYAVRASAREVRGFAGPRAQVVAARALFGNGPVTLDSNEDLFALRLSELRAPPAARHVRRAAEGDLATLAAFRHDYLVEALHATPGANLRQAARDEMARAIAERTGFVLELEGRIVAYSGFNAQLPDVVQIGGVYTPRELRRNGYARAAVAGSLIDARDRGVTGAILFTDRLNLPARSAYVALGFEVVGDYGLIML
jgi:uncharacterized protein